MKRACGVLLPISSLPSKYGIGCFSKEAYQWIDQLKEAGQSYWQILPLVPTSFGDSPYQSFSTYAGNPYFIDLEALVEEGVLTQEEVEEADFGSEADSIDYEKLYNHRYPLLRKAYERSSISENEDYIRFMEDNGWWLKDYALFMAVKSPEAKILHPISIKASPYTQKACSVSRVRLSLYPTNTSAMECANVSASTVNIAPQVPTNVTLLENKLRSSW